MKKRTLLIIPFMILGFMKLFSQDILLQDFKSKDFNLKYPKKFKVDTAGNTYSFYYDTRLGDITISVYESQKLSADELKQIVLDVNEHKERNPAIQLSDTNGVLNCLYTYSDRETKYFVRAIQNDKKCYLISLNWNADSWDSYSDLLLKSFNSFNPK